MHDRWDKKKGEVSAPGRCAWRRCHATAFLDRRPGRKVALVAYRESMSFKAFISKGSTSGAVRETWSWVS